MYHTEVHQANQYLYHHVNWATEAATWNSPTNVLLVHDNSKPYTRYKYHLCAAQPTPFRCKPIANLKQGTILEYTGCHLGVHQHKCPCKSTATEVLTGDSKPYT